MLLGNCIQGDKLKIIRINGNSRLKNRLSEMGLLKGSGIKILKYAPLKDPMEILIKGFHLSLRVEEAMQIEVEKEE